MKRIYGLMAFAAVLTITIIAGIHSQANVSMRFTTVSYHRSLARLSEEDSIKAAGRGTLYINLSDGQDFITKYEGNVRLVQAVESNQAKPLSLTSADFDEDGIPDLVAGNGGAGGGIVTLHRGNVDAIYPNAPEAKLRRENNLYTDAPFLSPALVYQAPEQADFIGVGDFDGDSHWDVVTAKRGSNHLYLLSGDGKGGLSLTKTIELPGGVTAFAVGEINRRDGLEDLVVAVKGDAGAQALVFEGATGALRAEPETFAIAEAATSLALGQLDDEYTYDLAMAAGHELIVVHGRDRKTLLNVAARVKAAAAKVDTRVFPFAIRSITLGDFKGRGEQTIALLGEDGKLRLLGREQLTEPTVQSGGADSWGAVLASGDWSATSQLNRLAVSNSSGDALLITDPQSQRLEIFTQLKKSKTDAVPSGNISLVTKGDIAAAIPMRLNADALPDLVVLGASKSGLSVLRTEPQQAFPVTNTNDSGPGSLRQAILDANANPGNDTITFSIGSGVQTITPVTTLPYLYEPVTLDATSQPGFSGSPLIVLSGERAGNNEFGLGVFSSNCVIRGFVISYYNRAGILLSDKANIVEGNYIGTDVSGTMRTSNDGIGIKINSQNNIIGGTTANARNIIVGGAPGIEMFEGSSDTRIQGNYIGTDVTGALGLSNSVCGGIYIKSQRNTIGGTTPGAKNLISGNSTSGIQLNDLDSTTKCNFGLGDS